MKKRAIVPVSFEALHSLLDLDRDVQIIAVSTEPTYGCVHVLVGGDGLGEFFECGEFGEAKHMDFVKKSPADWKRQYLEMEKKYHEAMSELKQRIIDLIGSTALSEA